jgi:WD40 repeat protein/transcriptional regulator with XRE-family HTH domain
MVETSKPGGSPKSTAFGALLRTYRVDAGLTQAALAERAGLSVRAVQHLEAGRGQPYPDTARRLAEALPLDPAAREALLAATEPTPRRRNGRVPAADLTLLIDSSDADQLTGLAEALQNAHGIHATLATWGADVDDDHLAELRGAHACAVFVGARGLGDWSSGPLAIVLGRPAREADPRLIAVLLPGAPEPFDATTLPPPLNTRPWVDLRSGVDVDFTAQQLARMLRGSQDPLRASPALETAECPYRGLEAFDEEHASLFFGREAAVQRLLEQLKGSRFIAVVAPSGSGKSSLVRAGLLPALRQGAISGSQDWIVCKFTPGPAPLQALSTELLQLPERGSFERTLARMPRDSRALHQSVASALARYVPSARLVCVVDQFEEVFTQCLDEDQRGQFVANLLYAASVPDGRTVVILTMRADFYAHCAAYPDLASQLAAHQYLLGPLDRAGTRLAISAPAERLGFSFEPGLVDTIAEEVAGEPGALPLLEHALLEVWARRQGRVLTLEGYRASGGVQGALAQRADSIFLSLDPHEQEIAREVLLRLTEPGETTEDTRRRATMDELVASASERELTERVTLALADGRLLTTSGGGEQGQAWVEVAHEALIRGWPRLRQWVDEDRAALRVRRRLTEAAHEWDRLDRDDGALYRAGVLAEALELRDRKQTGLNELEQEFLDAGVALQDRELRAKSRGRQLAVLALCSGLVLALVLGGLAALQWQRAESERGVALGRELAFEADAARKGAGVLLPRSVLLAAEALSRFPPRDSEPTLRQDLALLAHPILSLPQTGQGAIAAYSPDGQYLATGNANGDAVVWAVADGRQVSTMAVGSPLRAITWSRDAQYLATASNDGSARVWDPGSGRGLEQYDQPGAVYALAFSPDGSKLATASMDGNTRIWDRATHEALRLSTTMTVVDQFSPDGGNEFAESFTQTLAYSPDGRQLATARTSDNVAHVWDAQTGAELMRLEHDGVVLAIAFSPDGQYIATGSSDGSTRIWNRAGIQVGRTTTDRSSPTFAVAFSPDSHYLATGGFSFAAEVVQVPQGTDVLQLPLDDSAQNLAWSPDGKAVAAASNDGTARIWALDGGHEIARMPMGFDNVVYEVEFSPDGTQVATASADGVVRTWQATKAWQDVGLNHGDSVIAVAFSGDGRYLASSAGTTAYIWDAHTGAQLQRLEHPALAWALHFSPDGRYLASSSFDGYARIWDVATGQQVTRFLHGERERVYGVRFSTDGKLLATAGLKGGVKVWNIASGDVTMQATHDSAAGYLRFTPDGKYLISGSVDHTARVWDLASGREVRRMAADSPLYELDISPDGRLLAGGDDHDARIWDLATGAQLLLLPHATGVNGVAFSADGKYLATAAKDGVARVWLVGSGAQVAGMAHDKTLNGLAFSPDGSYLATASGDKTVRLWTPLLSDPIGAACTHVIANLTPAEWTQYLPGETYQATCRGLP